MEEFPYKVEYAKSNRSKCRHCKIGISKEELRMAAMVQSFFHDGKDAHWFHMKCFFVKHRPQSIDLIEHYEDIRIEDQRKIREKVNEMRGILLPEPKKKGKKRGATDDSNEAGPSNAAAMLKDFGVEYSKSSRAMCAGCGQNICMSELRIKKMDYTTEVGMSFGGQAFWHHVECFKKISGQYNFYLGGEDLPGFSDLSPEDQIYIKKTIEPIKLTASQAKKLKAEPRDKDEIAAEEKLEELIAKQTKQMFKVRDTIKPLTSKTDLQNILFSNGSGMLEGNDSLLERCADFLTFGAIKKCQKCKKGDMIFSKHGYKCNGNIDEWTLCENFEEKPERVKCKIPSELKSRFKKMEENNFFTKYVSKVEDRAVRRQNKTAIKKLDGDKREFKVQREKEPLYGMHCIVIGKTDVPKDELKIKIQSLGGKLVTKIQEHIAFVISNEDEVDKMNMRMSEVKSYGIQVVPESFIAAIEKGKREDTIEKIKSMSICDWDCSDPLQRIPQEEDRTERESIYNRSKKKTAVVKLKNGTAIDPDSNLSDCAHVYKDEMQNLLYTTVLTHIDIQKNKNSYYKLQVLESDNRKQYWLFRAWGRIGTGVGDNKTESYGSADEAIDAFEQLFHDKSGNTWGTEFKKLPNKYSMVEVDYDDEEKMKVKEELEQIPSKLPTSVQEIVKMIFDLNLMKNTMKEFELDLDKMPLGKLSNKQLTDAYSTLNQLDALIKDGEESESKFIGLTNKFFTLIPHAFGMKKAPVINTIEMIQQKRDMIDSLMEIEIAYSLIKQEDKENTEKVNPVDAHYGKLKTELKPLDKKKEEFKLIEKYIKNTHAETHNQYSLEIEDIFKVKREKESRRYKPFKKLHNRQLLWHGSRLTNYVGILSHGLKIAPPEAPVTGYMFGKGLYFADMVSKSANYCCTSTRQPTGLMLLSEVALGDMYELNQAKNIKKLPDGKHSAKGIGSTAPNPKDFHIRDDGVTIPCGKPMKNDTVRSGLLYNEYIVYDVAQVNIQYLLKLKFNYNRQ